MFPFDDVIMLMDMGNISTTSLDKARAVGIILCILHSACLPMLPLDLHVTFTIYGMLNNTQKRDTLFV